MTMQLEETAQIPLFLFDTENIYSNDIETLLPLISEIYIHTENEKVVHDVCCCLEDFDTLWMANLLFHSINLQLDDPVYSIITGNQITLGVEGNVNYTAPDVQTLIISTYETKFSFSGIAKKDNFEIYMINNTDDPRLWVYDGPGSAMPQIHGIYQSENETFNGYEEFESITAQDIPLRYSLKQLISLDSEYYNVYNTRFQVYTPTITDYTTESGYSWNWESMDYNGLILRSPYYKIRIYDSNTNEMIYQDSSFHRFNLTRSVHIDSLLFQNNAHEPVNFSLLENGHYQSSSNLSWDLDIPNLRPDNVNYSDEGVSYLVNKYQNHNKVLYSNTTASLQYGYNNSQFNTNLEGFINASGSNCFSYVVPQVLDTKNVLIFDDRNSGGYCQLTKYVDNPSAVSFRIAVNDSTQDTCVYFYDESMLIGNFHINGGNWLWESDDDWFFSGVTNNEFIHASLLFDSRGNSVILYENGEIIATKTTYAFSRISHIIIRSGSSSEVKGYFSSFYHGNDLDEMLSSVYPTSYVEIDNSVYSYKTEHTIDWGTYDNENLSMFSVRESGDTSVSIAEMVDSHSNVLNISDSDNIDYSNVIYNFDATTEELDIEFWWRFDRQDSSTQRYLIFKVQDSSSYNVLYSMLNYGSTYGRIAIQDGITANPYAQVCENLSSCEWIHLRYVINVETDLTRVLVNNIDCGFFNNRNDCSNIARIIFETREASTSTQYNNYIDGLGLSINNYSDFENYPDSFKRNCAYWGYNSTTYNYKYYNSSQEAITGVEQWDSDDWNSIHDYKLVNGDPKSGVDQWGTSTSPDLSAYTDQSDSSCVISVIASKDNRANVIQCYDNNAIFGSCNLISYCSYTDVYLEFMIANSDASGGKYFRYYVSGDGGQTIACIGLENGIVYYHDSAGSATSTGATYSANEFIHVKMYIDTSNDQQTIWIDGTKYVDAEDFYLGRTAVSMTNWQLLTEYAPYGFYGYFDAIGISSEGYSSNTILYRYIDDWIDINCTSSIKSSLIGHENILNFSTNYINERVDLTNITSSSSGTIEFYIYLCQTNKQMNIALRSSSAELLRVSFDTTGYIDIYGSTTESNVVSYLSNLWYHVKITYANSGTSYVYLNGVLISTLTGKSQNFEDLRIYDGSGNGECYIDSIGITVNSYTIGDNLLWYEFYNYGYGNTTSTVVNQLDNHYHVLNLTDYDSAQKIMMDYSFNSQTNGYVEFWIRFTDVTKYSYIYLYQGSSVRIYLTSLSSYLQYYDGNGAFHQIQAIENGVWYHIKIVFECGSDQYDGLYSDRFNIYINGVLAGSNLDFRGDGSAINILRFGTNTAFTDYSTFYDGIGVSGVKNYVSFDNYPDSISQNGTVEFWQNNLDSTTFDMGEFRLIWNSTGLYSWNSLAYTEIFTGNFNNNTWIRYTISWNLTEIDIFQNTVLILNTDRNFTELNRFRWIGFGTSEFYIDAIDFTIENSNPNYELGANVNLNLSEDLWCAEAFPNWEHGYYQSTVNNEEMTITAQGTTTYEFSDLYDRKDMIHTYFSGTGNSIYVQKTFNDIINGDIEFTFSNLDITDVIIIYIYDPSYNIGISGYLSHSSYGLRFANGTITQNVLQLNDGDLVNLRVNFDCNTDLFSIFVNNSIVAQNFNFKTKVNQIDRISIFGYGNFATDGEAWFDSFCFSDSEEYHRNMGSLENITKHPLDMNYNLSIQAFPYSQTFSNITFSDYLVNIYDLYGNSLEIQTIDSNEDSVIYTPPNTQECFITLADQSGNYLNWENYKLYLNSTLIYSNLFYEELANTVNISIYDKFGNYITSTIHVVAREENYIPLTINLYSLKIFNQQEEFLHLNISQGGTSYSWSEWLAPMEVAEYKLVPDTYSVSITSYEGGESTTNYNLNFASDDILLISSSNTLASVILSMQNLNVTLDEQFTFIQLNFTNVNSAIGNQTYLIQINFENQNSTIEEILLSNQFTYTFINSTLNDLYSLSLNSWNFANTSLNNLYVLSENSYVFLNSTCENIWQTGQNSWNFANTTLNSVNTISLFSFEYLNSSIENSITYMAQNFTYLSSEIDLNQLEILTQFSIISSEISNSSTDIINSIIAVNSSICNLTNELINSVFLINNTIYTAVLNTTTAIQLQNNLILGNLWITYQQNEFLTDILKHTLFSELLDWSGVGYNYSLIADQIETVSVINNIKNESIKVLFEYQNEIEEQILGALNILDMNLPKTGVKYRIYSVANQSYLTEWEDIPDNKTISWGEYEEVIPATPEDVETEMNDWILAIEVLGMIAGIAIAIILVMVKKLNPKTKIHLLRE